MTLSHLEIGEQLELFMTHEYSPGSVFLLPHGTRLYRAMEKYLLNEYKVRGFQEVMTPQLGKIELWKKTGHYDHYKENMFWLDMKHESDDKCCDDEHLASIKPMNCGFHCLIFNNKTRSYKDLPLRFADFGCLHRNEASGALRGMTRLRKFSQDDAHIFCTYDQIESEIANCLEFLSKVYNKIGFDFRINLSTRPDKFSGDVETWNNAEEQLRKALISSNISYTINEKDGAFYGPKLDVMLKDYNGREYQCGTIQLDFQLPERLDINYVDSNNNKVRPVIIHRAIMGSMERMMAILMEHYQGKFPMWLSPRQFMILPIVSNEQVLNHCKYLESFLSKMYHIDVDASSNTLEYKIRQAELLHYNYIIVIGKKEAANKTVTFRIQNHIRKDETMSLDQFELKHF